MLDWLGLSPTATKIIGWILIAIAIILLAVLIWYLVKAIPQIKENTENIKKLEKGADELESIEKDEKVQKSKTGKTSNKKLVTSSKTKTKKKRV